MPSNLNAAEQDADGSFWYYDVSGTLQRCPPSISGASNSPSNSPGSSAPPTVISQDKKHWVEIAMLDVEGNPLPGQDYEIKLPDGSIVTGSLDERGTARVEGIDPGTCKIRFPSLDKTVWRPR